MNYLLDTNVISELVKSSPDKSLLKWIETIDSENFFLSVISIGEIRKRIAGIQNPHRQQKIAQWLEIDLPQYFEHRILNIDLKIADMWGQLQSKNKGYTLPAIDGLLAATAHVHNLVLVTRNEKDFVKTSIEILNPWNNIEPEID